MRSPRTIEKGQITITDQEPILTAFVPKSTQLPTKLDQKNQFFKFTKLPSDQYQHKTKCFPPQKHSFDVVSFQFKTIFTLQNKRLFSCQICEFIVFLFLSAQSRPIFNFIQFDDLDFHLNFFQFSSVRDEKLNLKNQKKNKLGNNKYVKNDARI